MTLPRRDTVRHTAAVDDTPDGGVDGGTRRRMHLVGTLSQFDGPAAALSWQRTALAGRVRRLTGGETGDRANWIVPVVQRLARERVVRRVRSGDWTGYDDVDRFAVRRGQRLEPVHLDLRVARHGLEELDLLAGSGHPATEDLPLQVGVPGSFDVALFSFGPAAALRLEPVFRRRLGQEIAALHARAGRAVVFQLEVPVELVAVAAAPEPLRPVVARVVARPLLRQVAEAPPGTRFGVHLCLGDLGHRALRQVEDAAPLVHLTNALVRRWPAGRSLDFVHLPLSGGDRPPSTDPRFHAPLRALRSTLPATTEVAAGLAHEEQHLADQVRVLDLVEQALGRTVDVATSCGLGRRSPEGADAAVRRTLELLG
ncbi:hypothetical protein CLV37_103272 [Kineococcus rhizosphaerae]|uniref:Methionine synthase II (Cobalamin-independent) n=1 Tax=Kineococcus rhizosphaerae TaxID=559628 RepID=A0A2T0R6U0_9ACTN|nr:hypothetical protein CLV37_103272 [Kineococcus rhizosphaerae]